MRMSMRDTRYRMPAETRHFGGKVYHYLMLGSKDESERDATRYRARGYSVRITRYGRQYAIYTRKG